MAAITAAKIRKMRFAAELYGVRYPTQKVQRLVAVAVEPAGITLLDVE